ncbi:MAG: hypothetical protein ACK5WK_15335 [Hyphomonadaceae bacterium]
MSASLDARSGRFIARRVHAPPILTSGCRFDTADHNPILSGRGTKGGGDKLALGVLQPLRRSVPPTCIQRC